MTSTEANACNCWSILTNYPTFDFIQRNATNNFGKSYMMIAKLSSKAPFDQQNPNWNSYGIMKHYSIHDLVNYMSRLLCSVSSLNFRASHAELCVTNSRKLLLKQNLFPTGKKKHVLMIAADMIEEIRVSWYMFQFFFCFFPCHQIHRAKRVNNWIRSIKKNFCEL